jgi:organic hydroperoxide reductase OsmC/OhrA
MINSKSMNSHNYDVSIIWTGNNGDGTKTYRSYRRDHVISAANKPEVPGSSDPHFRGDPSRYNPEELLVAALSACHMLSYLHLCAVNNIVVTAYDDNAHGTMQENPNGSGEFTQVVLRPRVTIAAGDSVKAQELHHRAHELCFIGNSVKFPVEVEPTITIAELNAV